MRNKVPLDIREAVRVMFRGNQKSGKRLPKFGNSLYPSYGTLGAFPVSTLSFIAVIESENPLDPYVQSWNVSAERELGRSTTLEVNYIGTHSIHLLDRRNIAQPNDLPATDAPFCAANPTDTTHDCPASSRLPRSRIIARGEREQSP